MNFILKFGEHDLELLARGLANPIPTSHRKEDPPCPLEAVLSLCSMEELHMFSLSQEASKEKEKDQLLCPQTHKSGVTEVTPVNVELSAEMKRVHRKSILLSGYISNNKHWCLLHLNVDGEPE
uniref:Uncharacterized protein n=1 Tax=Molossus molossus TaxID=27622 RepID=A0A7J8DTT3_MOLMO|nr:hypothetical protein HJG59_009107 [Molossus molossus]